MGSHWAHRGTPDLVLGQDRCGQEDLTAEGAAKVTHSMSSVVRSSNTVRIKIKCLLTSDGRGPPARPEEQADAESTGSRRETAPEWRALQATSCLSAAVPLLCEHGVTAPFIRPL